MVKPVHRTEIRKLIVAVAITSCISIWPPPLSAESQYYTGFGETLAAAGCDKSRNLVIPFHETAENMRQMKNIPGSKMDDTMIRDYLHKNLELDDLPKDSGEYKVFSRMAKLILDGEDMETVQTETLKVCQREFGT